MRHITLMLIVTTTGLGCSDQRADTNTSINEAVTSETDSPIEYRIDTADGEPVPPEIEKELEEISRKQSKGLSGATVIVHRAYEYHGYSWVKPVDVAKLIAVDVEFRNYNQGLDLDDVDIIDGATNENYGSYPHIAHLTPDGELAADEDDLSWPEDLGPLRILLIYAFPKEAKTIKLGYWGAQLTPEAIRIAGNGPSLPQRSRAGCAGRN